MHKSLAPLEKCSRCETGASCMLGTLLETVSYKWDAAKLVASPKCMTPLPLRQNEHACQASLSLEQTERNLLYTLPCKLANDEKTRQQEQAF